MALISSRSSLAAPTPVEQTTLDVAPEAPVEPETATQEEIPNEE